MAIHLSSLPLPRNTHSTLAPTLHLTSILRSYSLLLTSSIPFLQLSVILVLMRLQIAKFCFSPGHDRAHNRLSNVIAALKQLFAVVSRSNIHLSLHHIPSRFNLADTPSRRFSLLDSMLSSDTWAQVQGHFDGPSGHSVDLMALPSNVQHASSGHPLPFFSPVPSPGASGVNVFSQLPHHHPYPQGGCTSGSPFAECVARQPSC